MQPNLKWGARFLALLGGAFYTRLKRKLEEMRSWQKTNILERKRCASLNKYGVQVLDIIHRSMSKGQIVYWLYAGTLLGIIRDGNFIQDDTDIDIGVWYDRKQQYQLQRILVAKGFTKIHEYEINSQILLQSFEYQGVIVDFYYFILVSGRAFESSFVGDKCYLARAHYDARDLSAMKIVPFKGIQVSVPQDPTKLLARFYGNWRVPVKKKDFLQNQFGHPNRVHYRSKLAVCRQHAPSIHKATNYDAFFLIIKKLRWERLPGRLIRYASRNFKRRSC